ARKAELLARDILLEAHHQRILAIAAGGRRGLPGILLAALEIVGWTALDARMEQDSEAARRRCLVVRHVVGVIVVLRYADGLDAVEAALVKVFDGAHRVLVELEPAHGDDEIGPGLER